MPSDFPSASYDLWKTRVPEESLSDVCGGCGYFIDECVCDEERENE